MTKILAFDTTGETCSVALSDGQTIHSEFCSIPRQQTEIILATIQKLLSQAQLTLAQLDVIAVTHGPGSFTGVRIGITVAQGLAYAANLPVTSVSSLKVLAQGMQRQFAATKLCVALDARMQEIYLGFYEFVDNVLQLMGSEVVCKPADIIIPSGLWSGAGSGWDSYANELTSLFSKSLQQVYSHVHPHAQDLLTLAGEQFSQGKIFSPTELIPNYLRDKVTHS